MRYSSLHIDLLVDHKHQVKFVMRKKYFNQCVYLGILIAKKSLFTDKIPVNVGDGAENYVIRRQTEFYKDIEIREEGVTPEIVGSIRAGLVFHVKEIVEHHFIEQREDELVMNFFLRFRDQKNLVVLGSSTAPGLAIFSFLIYVSAFKKYLHHNFISVLLNDLFGIQVQSGCSDAQI